MLKKAGNRAKGFPYHTGFSSHTYSKEFGFGATLYVNLHYTFILSIIHIFNILHKMPIVQETNINTDNPVHCTAFLLLGFIGNYKILFRMN